jgi:hypothetical protein
LSTCFVGFFFFFFFETGSYYIVQASLKFMVQSKLVSNCLSLLSVRITDVYYHAFNFVLFCIFTVTKWL